MAKTKISEFSSTPANNTDIDSINIAEGCAPSGINDAIRELMAQLKDFQTGAVGDSFNGPIGSSTASTGAFTTLSATGAITSTLATGTAPLVIASTTKVANLNVDLLDGADWASPAALGSTTPAAVSATTLSASSTVTLSGGTANGVAYLNGSKVVTSGSALTFDGTNFATTGNANLGSGSKSTDTQLNFLADTGTQRIYIERGSRSLVFYDVGAAIENYRIAGITGIQSWGVGGSEQMRLNSTGLGIGTSSPTNGKLEIQQGTTTAALWAQTGGTTSSYTIADFRTGTNASAFATFGDTSSVWQGGGMTLNASGNLGLGVTPSAWGSSYKAIDVASIGASFAGSSYGAYVTSNAYSNGTNWIYKAGTYGAAYYNQFNGGHVWFNAPSGTAGNAITFTQAMTLDANGKLLVGGTSTASLDGVFGVVVGGSSQASAGVGFEMSTSQWLIYIDSTQSLRFYDSRQNVERAQIDSSGNLLVGTTNTNPVGNRVNGNFVNASGGLNIRGGDGNTALGLNITSGTHITFYTDNGSAAVGAGTITSNGSVTLYNATSDYRLKTVTGAVTGQGSRIDALKPIDYLWKDGNQQARGFLAHEFETVYPNSVTGAKDAVDADGNPVYQAMQASTAEVIADLVAEIQSLRVRVAQLESN